MAYRIRVNHWDGISYIHRSEDVPKGEKSVEWPDQDAALARCDKANAEAVKLGIKTRYIVEEAK